MTPRRSRAARKMAAYWDSAAAQNAVWYVDTSLRYDVPDMEQFFATGRTIVAQALDEAPAKPARYQLAVEIGSGLGRVCLALADRFDQVVGIDVAPEMIRQAAEVVRHPRVRFELGDGATLAPIEDATADLVLSFTVFQHMPSARLIEGYLRESGRVLRPGGMVVFQWNNLPGTLRWAGRRAVLSALQRTGVRRERHGRNDAAFLGSRVPLRQIERALSRSGLQLVGTHGTGTMWSWAWAVRP